MKTKTTKAVVKTPADCGREHPQRYCTCKACAAVRPVVKLDAAFLEAVKQPIYRTWNAIAADVCGLGRMSNSGNMEMVLDANRMAMYGGGYGKTGKHEGVVADELVGSAIMQHTYTKVSRYLCKHIKLDC